MPSNLMRHYLQRRNTLVEPLHIFMMENVVSACFPHIYIYMLSIQEKIFENKQTKTAYLTITI